MKVEVVTTLVAALGLKALIALFVADLVGLGLALLWKMHSRDGGRLGRTRGRYRGWLIRLTVEWGPQVGPATLDR